MGLVKVYFFHINQLFSWKSRYIRQYRTPAVGGRHKIREAQVSIHPSTWHQENNDYSKQNWNVMTAMHGFDIFIYESCQSVVY